MIDRVFIAVLDGFGVGAQPDADATDQHANTVGNVALAVGGLKAPNLESLGLGNVVSAAGLRPMPRPLAAHGRMRKRGACAESYSGHWEIAGSSVMHGRRNPNGFERRFVAGIEDQVGVRFLANLAVADPLAAVHDFLAAHANTGQPILLTELTEEVVNTFGIYADIEVTPLLELHLLCERVAAALATDHRVGRVGARPFQYKGGIAVGHPERRDYLTVAPPLGNLVDATKKHGRTTASAGKVAGLFNRRSFDLGTVISQNWRTEPAWIDALEIWEHLEGGLLWANFNDFDTPFGHKKDPHGWAGALQWLDARLPNLVTRILPTDLLIITADHGCDPVVKGDHTREYVPLLVFSPSIQPADLGERSSFADIAATVADLWGFRLQTVGVSFAGQLGLHT